MKMDEILYRIAEKVKSFAVIYLVDITKVPGNRVPRVILCCNASSHIRVFDRDFNKMYELYDPCTVMFFFRNKHIMIDLGTGNNNKINWALEDKQELIDIVGKLPRALLRRLEHGLHLAKRNCLQGSKKGEGARCLAQGLFHQVQVLSCVEGATAAENLNIEHIVVVAQNPGTADRAMSSD